MHVNSFDRFISVLQNVLTEVHQIPHVKDDPASQLENTLTQLTNILTQNGKDISNLVTDNLNKIQREVKKLPETHPLAKKIEILRLELEQTLFINLLNQHKDLPFLAEPQNLTPERIKRFAQLLETFDQQAVHPPDGDYLIELCASFPDERIRQLAANCIEQGAPLEAKNFALLNAVFRSDRALVEKLLASGASVHYRTNSGVTPLSLCVSTSDWQMMDLLLNHGASFQEEHEGMPLWFTTLCSQFSRSTGRFANLTQSAKQKILKDVLDQLDPDSINKKDAFDKTLLDHALEKEDFIMAVRLIERGAAETNHPDKLKNAVQDALSRPDFLNSTKLLKNLIHQSLLPVRAGPHLPVLAILRSDKEELKNLLLANWSIGEEQLPHLEKWEKCAKIIVMASLDGANFSLLELKNALHEWKEIVGTFEKNGFTKLSQHLKEMNEPVNVVQIEIRQREEQARRFIEQNINHTGKRAVNGTQQSMTPVTSKVKRQKKPLTAYLRKDVLDLLIDEKQFNHLASFTRLLAPQVTIWQGIDKPIYLFAMDKVVQMMGVVNPQAKAFSGGQMNTNALALSDALAFAQKELNEHQDISENDKTQIRSLLMKLEQCLGLLSQEEELNPINFKRWDQSLPLFCKTGYIDHYMLFTVERNSNDTYRFTLYNTGDGLGEHHPAWENTNKYMTHLTFDQVPASDALNEERLRQMKSFLTKAKSPEDAYKLLEEWAVNGVKLPPSPHEQDYEQIQMEGTCSAQCIMAFMRDFIMRNTSGSAWEKLGLYKELKARVITRLLSPNIEVVNPLLQPHIEKKIQKYHNDLRLLEIAQDAHHYRQIIESGKSLFDEHMLEEMLNAASTYERFAMLRAALRHVAYNTAENISEELGILSDVMKARFETRHEGVVFAIRALDSLIKTKPTEAKEAFERLIHVPLLRQPLIEWREQQNPSVVESWET